MEFRLHDWWLPVLLWRGWPSRSIIFAVFGVIAGLSTLIFIGCGIRWYMCSEPDWMEPFSVSHESKWCHKESALSIIIILDTRNFHVPFSLKTASSAPAPATDDSLGQSTDYRENIRHMRYMYKIHLTFTSVVIYH